MKKIDYVSHKIELPVSGTKEELMQQLLLLLDYIGVKLPKRVQKTTKQQGKQVRLPNKSVTLSESQALKILEEFKKGEERRYDGKSWVDFKLTAKQSEFARLIAEENLTSSDAYRLAYKPKPSVDNKSIHEMACRVMKNVKVQSRISNIKDAKS